MSAESSPFQVIDGAALDVPSRESGAPPQAALRRPAGNRLRPTTQISRKENSGKQTFKLRSFRFEFQKSHHVFLIFQSFFFFFFFLVVILAKKNISVESFDMEKVIP